MTRAVSLRQIKTLIANAYSVTHAAVEQKLRTGVRPGGVRLSLGLQDCHDIIADLNDALPRV